MSILHVDENKHKAGFFEGLLSSCEGYVKRHGNSEGRIQDNNHTRKRLGVAVKHVPVPDADIRISRAINMLMEAVSQKK